MCRFFPKLKKRCLVLFFLYTSKYKHSVMDSSMIIIIILSIIIVLGAAWMMCKKSYSPKEPIVSVSNIAKSESYGSVPSDSAKNCNELNESAINLVNQECFQIGDSEIEPWMYGQQCDYGKLESKVDSHGFMFHGIIINPHRKEQPTPDNAPHQINEAIDAEVSPEPGVKLH